MSFLGDRDDLLELLTEELDEACEVFERALLALEEGDAGALPDALRVAHSFKGACSAVDVPPLARATHELETVLAALRDGALEPSPATISLLLHAVDELGRTRDQVRAGRLPASALTSLVARLRELTADGAAFSSAEQAGEQAGEQMGEQAGARAATPAHPGAAATRPATTPAPAAPGIAEAAPGDGDVEAAGRAGPWDFGAEGTVRVAASRLRELVAASGELVTVRHLVADLAAETRATRAVAEQHVDDRRRRTRPGGPSPAASGDAEALADLATRLRGLDERLRGVSRLTTRIASAVQDAAVSAALSPFGDSAGGLSRAVRDTAEAVGVQARLRVEGAEVEADRRVVAALREPLLHLLRNAVAHGIEAPDERSAKGKAPSGEVRVLVRHDGGELVVEVADDGAGIDFAAVRRALADLEPGSEASSTADEANAEEEDVESLFVAGLTTARRVSEHAGRGVGMDIVRRDVEGIGGRVAVSSIPGVGTRVTLRVPITLSTMRVVLATIGDDEPVAVLASPVERVVRVGPDDTVTVGDRLALPDHGGPVPLLPLEAAFSAAPGPGGATTGHALLVRTGDGLVGLLVDSAIADRDVLVTPFGTRLDRATHALGMSVLSDGRRVVVLHPVAAARQLVGHTGLPVPSSERATTTGARVLVVEDAPTTRALERSVLEAAGYDAVAVADGAEALAYLDDHDVDLVVTDLEMPRVDGLELCATLRRSPRWQELPVVLVTSFDSAEDRRRGLDAGADAYLGKADFDQDELLRTIAGLL